MWNRNRTVKVVSTFAGLGGSSFGYTDAGHEVVGAVEFQADIAAVYRLNHPVTDCWTVNVRDITGADLRHRFGDFDLLDGSPPCQAFSLMGVKGKERTAIRRHTDLSYQRSDDLIFDWTRLVQEARPEYAVMENVAVLAGPKWRKYLVPLLVQLKAAGYRIEVTVLQAELLGNPSTRTRLVIIASRQALKPYRWPTKQPPAASTVLPGHGLVIRTGSERKYAFRSLALPAPAVTATGLGFGARHHSALIDDSIEVDPVFNERLIRPWQGEAIRAGRFRQMRMLTIDEVRRLMSFPVLVWPSGITHLRAWAMIGNSVPPVLSQVVIDRIAA